MQLEHYVILGLMLYLIIRELFFMYSTQKLVNKLMSRDYYSYKMSEKVGVPEPPKPTFKDEDEGLAEDLNTLFS